MRTSDEACNESISSCENCIGVSLYLVLVRAGSGVTACSLEESVCVCFISCSCVNWVVYLVKTCLVESPGFEAP